jgi:serine/threonine-protein kinase RsbW
VVGVRNSQLSEHRPAAPEYIGPLRRAVVAVAAGAGATERQLEDVGLAVSEALTNAVRHAYPAGESGTMTIQASVDDGQLEVRVRDGGRGMPAPSEKPGSGLGLLIIARVTDSLELRDAAPGVDVHMAFELG